MPTNQGRAGLTADETWLVGAVMQRMMEEYFGCPIEDITGGEIERWITARCLDESGLIMTREVDVLRKVLA